MATSSSDGFSVLVLANTCCNTLSSKRRKRIKLRKSGTWKLAWLLSVFYFRWRFLWSWSLAVLYPSRVWYVWKPYLKYCGLVFSWQGKERLCLCLTLLKSYLIFKVLRACLWLIGEFLMFFVNGFYLFWLKVVSRLINGCVTYLRSMLWEIFATLCRGLWLPF